MCQYLWIEGSIANVKSPDGTAINMLQTPNLITMANVISVSVIVSRSPGNESVVTGMSLIISTIDRTIIPLATLTDVGNAEKRKKFDDFTLEVLNKTVKPTDSEHVTPTTF